MRGIVEVPLVTADGTKLGKVRIDKNGRMKIEMKEWARPGDLDNVLAFLRNISQNMDQTVTLRNKTRRNSA